MKRTWYTVIAEDQQDRIQNLNSEIVQALEAKCPRFALSDKDKIKNLLEHGILFGNETLEWRYQLFRKLCSLERPIPSFTTFFKDVNVLQEYALCMRHLFDIQESTDTALSLAYNGPDKEGSALELWLFARRNFQDMPLEPRKKDNVLLAKTRCGKASKSVLYDFASLASRSGFTSRQIEHITKNYTNNSQEASGVPDSTQRLAPLRYGFPDTASFKKNKYELTVETLYQTPEASAELDSMYILRSAFLAFHRTEDITMIYRPRMQHEQKRRANIAHIQQEGTGRWSTSISKDQTVRVHYYDQNDPMKFKYIQHQAGDETWPLNNMRLYTATLKNGNVFLSAHAVKSEVMELGSNSHLFALPRIINIDSELNHRIMAYIKMMKYHK